MILTGENRNILRKICSDATVSITNRTLTGLGSSSGERPSINRLRLGVAFSRSVSYWCILCISYVSACYVSVRLVIDLITLLQYSVNVKLQVEKFFWNQCTHTQTHTHTHTHTHNRIRTMFIRIGLALWVKFYKTNLPWNYQLSDQVRYSVMAYRTSNCLHIRMARRTN